MLFVLAQKLLRCVDEDPFTEALVPFTLSLAILLYRVVQVVRGGALCA